MTAIFAIGSPHPLAATLKALLPQVETVAWAEPNATPSIDIGAAEALIFLPPIWSSEPALATAVLDDLDVLWSWLNPWVNATKERKRGALLYVTSLDGICGTADNVLLAERDSAMLAQARAMAMELGKYGIRSNCLALGPLATTASNDETLSKNPLKRVGTYNEAAKTAAFLLGDAAVHVTGQLLVCAGGADIGRLVP